MVKVIKFLLRLVFIASVIVFWLFILPFVVFAQVGILLYGFAFEEYISRRDRRVIFDYLAWPYRALFLKRSPLDEDIR